MSTVATLTPTIPGREEFLKAALDSVQSQTRQPNSIIVEPDAFRTGAARTRNRALTRVDTDYVAFLDDDDVFLPNHLAVLMTYAEANPDVSVVYPTPRFVGMGDGTAVRYRGKMRRPWGIPYSEDHRQYLIQVNNFIPITALVKTKSLLEVGGFPEPGDSDARISPCEDYLMFRRLALRSYPFAHVDEETWIWRRGDWHTGGR